MKNRRILSLTACLLTVAFLGAGCGSSDSTSAPARTVPLTTSHALVAWNDLGMHCLDNSFAVFAILPPYNNLHAQLIDRSTGTIVTAGVTVTYEATADTRGSINSTSAGKTDFWDWVTQLFGVTPAPDFGLTNNPTPGTTPAAMGYDNTKGFWKAEGIPIVPMDDAGRANYYPMVKVVARNSRGDVLATTSTVLPVSNEMSCTGCHTSGGGPDAMPAGGWVFDNNAERDWKLNILRIHDEKNFGDNALAPVYAAALAAAPYNATGLENTVRLDGKPVLCASCHPSNALGTAGAAGVKPLTAAVHSWHAHVIQDATGLPLDNGADRSACYCCHPGSVTQCLRGVMGNAKDGSGNLLIQCQSCHGTMSTVGSAARRGWIDLPDCSGCHYAPAATGTYIRDNTTLEAGGAFRPAAGIFASPGLYKVSAGHGAVQCEACHGPTHAEYACSEANDNVQSAALQGYPGKIAECEVCHDPVPTTKSSGPHGLHTIGQAWVTAHGAYAKADPSHCVTCHGADYRGTILSAAATARTFGIGGQGTATFARSAVVGCYSCHSGPGGW